MQLFLLDFVCMREANWKTGVMMTYLPETCVSDFWIENHQVGCAIFSSSQIKPLFSDLKHVHVVQAIWPAHDLCNALNISKAWTLRSERHGFKFQPHHLLTLWFGKSFLNFLCFHFSVVSSRTTSSSCCIVLVK